MAFSCKRGLFRAKKLRNKSCWKCNSKDFLFNDFFSRMHILARKDSKYALLSLILVYFWIVNQKQVICGKRKHRREKSHKINFFQNWILKKICLMTFSVQCFLLPQNAVENDCFDCLLMEIYRFISFQASNNRNWSFSTAFCGKRRHCTEKSHKTKLL